MEGVKSAKSSNKMAKKSCVISATMEEGGTISIFYGIGHFIMTKLSGPLELRGVPTSL